MYFAGIDLGSTMTKIVIVDANENVRARVVEHTGAEHRHLANKVMEKVLQEAGISFKEIDYVVATGYGRINVPFADRQITELTCHARGVANFLPTVRLAIDIGGQDAKGLKIDRGKLVDFVMSDRCAAGTGRFLEVLAPILGLKMEDLGPISLQAKSKVSISSICTIFAKQEVISHISRGVPFADIVAGLHDSIASRVVRMVKRLKVEPDVVFTGGVAKNIGVVKALEERLGCKVFVPDEPLYSGALGAALLGQEITMKAIAKGETLEKKERRLEEVSFFK
ncbi:MAG: 2-hydroxyglutaryl-CoA dehydratase [Chloroflexi bacterium]|nr:2-hydroxyglutaryl-CoA dehydratase [Chloroflexota bacterium]